MAQSSKTLEILTGITFGEQVAEHEADALATYFVETEYWRRLFGGQVDVVYGAKGAGKSALYALLIGRASELKKKGVVLIPAENPRGATAFKDIATDPPASERAFIALWKLYLATLLHDAIQTEGLKSKHLRALQDALSAEGLVRGKRTLAGQLQVVMKYIARFLTPRGVETTVEFNPVTNTPSGVTGRIVFAEGDEDEKTFFSVDTLLKMANDAIADNKKTAWLLLDRLDVAFSDTPELEGNALKALFRAYLDMQSLDNVKLKIFLRKDIWKRITDGGFREASHVTKKVEINWVRNNLLNLIIRRALHNSKIRNAYGISGTIEGMSVDEQEKFFYRMFPDKVEIGVKKSPTLEWVLSRTCDGTKETAPRELIHFVNTLREMQIQSLEIGDHAPEGDQLFARGIFKAALGPVSKMRLEQTLFAENPKLRTYVMKMKGAKTSHSVGTLAGLWQVTKKRAKEVAGKLVEVGFFELREKDGEAQYWVPFLYRDRLELVQGSAERSEDE